MGPMVAMVTSPGKMILVCVYAVAEGSLTCGNSA
jgi:hypothetical protein